jgi:hypothetical protein
MKLVLCSLLSLFASIVCAAEFPVADITTHPGKDLDDSTRSWQGIPGIERAPKGRLWATWYSGDLGEGDIGNYALAATSGDEGKTWSKPLIIRAPAGTKIGDPIPWLDPKGRLWIIYNQLTAGAKDKGTPTLRGTMAIRTDNPDSATPSWSRPFLLAEGGILFGKPIVRASGGWVAPFFLMSPPTKDTRETGTLISTNEGESWAWLGGTSIAPGLRNFSEATLAQRKDGSLWMVIRTTKGLYESSSKDDGVTWSDAAPMPAFAGPATRACMRRLASGAFLLIYHDAKKNAKGTFGRERLAVWLSDDEGRSWPHMLLLDERNGVSYPDATQAPDGRIFVGYDHGRYTPGEKEVLVSTIREEDIRAGKVVSQDARLKQLVNRALAYGNHSELRDEAKVAASLPPKEKLHLYLLIGQSNMAGRGVLETERLSRLRVLKFSPRNAWTIGVEPLHYDKPAAVGAGIGMSFAREMAEANKDVTIGLIPCAVGGTPLQRWMKGGDLYEQALNRALLAMKDGTLKGILWHQGENDSSAEETARSYADRFATMIKDLRADLGAGDVPLVAGKLGEFLASTSKDGKPVFWPLVNEQLATIPARVPHTAVVESTGLKHKGDVVHFDTPSLREFGRRYATAMQALQK